MFGAFLDLVYAAFFFGLKYGVFSRPMVASWRFACWRNMRGFK